MRRRNVFKVATVYLIASWVLIQIAETTFPALSLPEWTVTFVVMLLLLGLPIALILAWAFEVTPEGIKKTVEVPAETIHHLLHRPAHQLSDHRQPGGGGHTSGHHPRRVQRHDRSG